MKKYLDELRISNEEINRITKESIQEALIYLLGKKDLDSISITEITKKAGVSRAAYYRNYQSKEAILKDFSNNVFSLVWNSLHNKDYINNSYEWFCFIYKQFKDNGRLLKLIIKAKQNYLFSFNEILNYDKYNAKEKYKVYALGKGIIALIDNWVKNDFDLSVIELANISVNLFNDINLLFKDSK